LPVASELSFLSLSYKYLLSDQIVWSAYWSKDSEFSAIAESIVSMLTAADWGIPFEQPAVEQLSSLLLEEENHPEQLLSGILERTVLNSLPG